MQCRTLGSICACSCWGTECEISVSYRTHAMVLQGSLIIRAPGILRSTALIHISCERHWKAQSLVWNNLFLLSVGPEVVWCMEAPAEKTSLLGIQFDSKQCREQFVTPLSRFNQSRCNSLAFRTSVILRLLLDFDTYGCVDPLGVIPLFLKKIADIIAPKLRIIFFKLIRLGLFRECWRSADVTAIPEGAPSPGIEYYRPISVT